jgi:hypothetical protein
MATITLSLNDDEQNAFQHLLDLALRNNGMGALSVVSHFVSLINQAAQTGAVQAQVNTSAAPVTQPAASPPQQPAQHGGGILEAIETR